jgi:hypothetical protein
MHPEHRGDLGQLHGLRERIQGRLDRTICGRQCGRCVAVRIDQPGEGEADSDFPDPARAEALDIAEPSLQVQINGVSDRSGGT